MLMAGADVTMICSVLLERGIDVIREIEAGMCDWMVEHDYQSVRQPGARSKYRDRPL
jgi:dihydroorotate dehydrogenase (fumarate)